MKKLSFIFVLTMALAIGATAQTVATDDFNSYLGFCPETQTAVVILSNLPPSYRIPATVMGVRLLEEMQ